MAKFKDYFNVYGTILSLIGIFLQILPKVNSIVKTLALIFTIILLVVILIISYFDRKIVNRRRLIATGRRYIQNTVEKVVLFGGDLSWVDDYFDVLKQIKDDGKNVEVYFSKEKYDNLSENAKCKLHKRLDRLKEIQIPIKCFQDDAGLRCIIVDPNSFGHNDDMKLFAAKRIKNDDKKNIARYHLHEYKYSDEVNREICKSFITNYILLKKNCDEFELKV